MTNENMTPEDWYQYFQQEPTPAMEWLQNLRDAVKGDWYDAGLAATHLNRLQIDFNKVKLEVESKFRSEQQRIQEGFKK